MQDSEQIVKFTESFFSNLKCQLAWENLVLKVTHVPSDFEQFYGKKSPYLLVFQQGIDENAELVTRGSFLLKTMTSYLDQVGKTSLIKLEFKRDYKEEFKRYLKLRNSELQSVAEHADYKQIFRFTFSTTLQYLNEKEQVLNSVFVKDGKVVDFELDKYVHSEGKENDIKPEDSKELYLAAKESVKVLVDSRITDARKILLTRLEREQTRIKQHYAQQRQELDNHLVKLREQLANVEKGAQDAASAQKKQRIIESMKQYENPVLREKLAKEEAFFLQDEIHKHTLNVHNKLVSTSIIYYPIFMFALYLKHKDGVKAVNVSYDPMADAIVQGIQCDTCKREPQQIFICSSSHVVCNNCFDECRVCHKGLCKQCMIKTCESCARKLCKNCAVRCTICWNDACTAHIAINYPTGKSACLRCLKRCVQCGAYGDVNHIKRTERGDICLKCERLASVGRPDIF